MKKLLVTLGGLLLAAGCSPAMIHTDGASSVPASEAASQAVQQTVAGDYTISDACRAELAGVKDGPEILARYDTWFGYWETQGNPPAEVSNTADGFRYEAAQAGATSC